MLSHYINRVNVKRFGLASTPCFIFVMSTGPLPGQHLEDNQVEMQHLSWQLRELLSAHTIWSQGVFR